MVIGKPGRLPGLPYSCTLPINIIYQESTIAYFDSIDNGHKMRVFSKISQIIGRFGQMGRINYGVFGVLFSVYSISTHFVLRVPSP